MIVLPFGFEWVSNTCICCGVFVNVYTLMRPFSTTTIRSLLSRTHSTSELNSNVNIKSFIRSSQKTTVKKNTSQIKKCMVIYYVKLKLYLCSLDILVMFLSQPLLNSYT